MQYLQRKDKVNSKAHIWNNKKNDTSCKMWSTGGLGKEKNYEIVDHTPKDICTMCENNYNTVKEYADRYQHLFDFFSEEHNLTLTTGEIDDIIYEVKQHLRQ